MQTRLRERSRLESGQNVCVVYCRIAIDVLVMARTACCGPSGLYISLVLADLALGPRNVGLDVGEVLEGALLTALDA